MISLMVVNHMALTTPTFGSGGEKRGEREGLRKNVYIGNPKWEWMIDVEEKKVSLKNEKVMEDWKHAGEGRCP